MKNSTKKARSLDDALDICDAAEEIAGEKKAPAAMVLACRLLCGTDEALRKALKESAERTSWAKVSEIHDEVNADDEDEDEDDEDDEDEDRHSRRRAG